MSTHPCATHCWRVGGAVTIGDDGRCPECGSSGRSQAEAAAIILDRRIEQLERRLAELELRCPAPRPRALLDVPCPTCAAAAGRVCSYAHKPDGGLEARRHDDSLIGYVHAGRVA